MTTVFISHSSMDDLTADRLASAFEAAGLEVWVDHKKIKPADNWSAEIQKALNDCDVGLLVLSPLSAKSEECDAEYRRILSLRKKLYVVVISTVEKHEFPWRLGTIQYVNLQIDFDGSIQTLAAAILAHGELPLSEGTKTGGYALTDDGLPFWQLDLPLIGREQQLADVEALLDAQNRVVTIYGSGGVGKTRLAAEIAIASRFEDGTIWHEVTENSTVEDLTNLIRRHLKLDFTTPADETWRTLNHRPVLLIVDNAEECRNLKAYSDRINHLDLKGGSRVLMTSINQWEPLRGVKLYRLSMLPLGDAEQIVKAMAEYEPPDYSLVGYERDIADAAHCHPKLIWYAVHWANKVRPANVIDMLQTFRGDDPDEALDDIVRRTLLRIQSEPNGNVAIDDLGRLSVCRGGFTIEAAHTLVKSRASLEMLKRCGLVNFDKTTQRHDIDLMVRQVVGENEIAKQAHFDYYLALAWEHDDKQDYIGLDVESDNLTTAFEWAHSAGQVEGALLLLNGCGHFLKNRGRFEQQLNWAQSVDEAVKKGGSEELRADIQNTVGAILLDYPFGNRHENLRQAVETFKAALIYYTPQRTPLDYARTQNNLGIAYNFLFAIEDPEKNLLQAVTAYKAALIYFTPESTPLDYATTQNNLGNAYLALSEIENRIKNLRQAVAAYKAALIYYTPDRVPLTHAGTQNNLGNAYKALSEIEDPEKNLRQAVRAYEAALVYLTPESGPLGYAATQNNLGTIYRALSQIEDRTGNLRRAVGAYEAALVYLTPENSPLDYSTTQNNLGNAFRHLSEIEDREGNLQRAMVAFETALRQITPESAPIAYATTLANIGLVLDVRGNPSGAIDCWLEAEWYFRQMHVIDNANLMLQWIADAE